MDYKLEKKMEDFNATLRVIQDKLGKCLSLDCPAEKMAAEAQLLNDKVIGKIKLGKVTLHENLLRKFESFMKMNVLYATHIDDIYRSVFFFEPYENKMFVFKVETRPFGMVDEFFFVVFDSLENMHQFLLDEADSVRKLPQNCFVKPVDYRTLVQVMC